MSEYRTGKGSGTRLGGILAALLFAGAGQAAAQVAVRPVDGEVVGMVRDVDGGAAIGYALVQVTARRLRVFTSPTRRFILAGLPAGAHRVEVRQIGFRPVELEVVVLPEAEGAGATPLMITLTRQTLVLPEIVVTAPSCEDPRRMTADGDAGVILDQLFTNAVRLLAMEHEYPVHARFERLSAGLVALDSVQWFTWDTLTTRSDDIGGYERGRVLRTGSRAAIRYFTTSDIARPAFRDHHCLWVAGLEEVAGEPLIRIDFAPARRVSSADWAGALFLDPVTSILRRSEARLVNIPRNAGGLRATHCEVAYMEIEPTLVHEQAANCYTTVTSGLTPVRQETWRLLDWEFTGRRPGGGSWRPARAGSGVVFQPLDRRNPRCQRKDPQGATVFRRLGVSLAAMRQSSKLNPIHSVRKAARCTGLRERWRIGSFPQPNNWTACRASLYTTWPGASAIAALSKAGSPLATSSTR